MEDTKLFSDYASFVADMASRPLYDIRVEELAVLMSEEDKRWQNLPTSIKTRYAKYIQEMEGKDRKTEWIKLFSETPNLTDENVVFMCKEWIHLYLKNISSKSGLEFVQDLWTSSCWSHQYKQGKNHDDPSTIKTWMFS